MERSDALLKLRSLLYSERSGFRLTTHKRVGEQLQKELKRLALEFDCMFIPKLTPDERAVGKYERDLTSYFERCLAEARKLLRKRVSQLKRRSHSRGEKWGFAEDETTIDRFAGWDEIARVLGFHRHRR